jgi:hypothetical protein
VTSEVAAASHRSRRTLDMRTRKEVLRLARRGQRHPPPEVLLKASHWAGDRLLFPLWRDLLWTVVDGLVGLGVALAVVFALHQSVGPVIAIALVLICGWVVHMRRRVVDVARVNHPES